MIRTSNAKIVTKKRFKNFALSKIVTFFKNVISKNIFGEQFPTQKSAITCRFEIVVYTRT